MRSTDMSERGEHKTAINIGVSLVFFWPVNARSHFVNTHFWRGGGRSAGAKTSANRRRWPLRERHDDFSPRFYLPSGLTDRAGCWGLRVATPDAAVVTQLLAGREL